MSVRWSEGYDAGSRRSRDDSNGDGGDSYHRNRRARDDGDYYGHSSSSRGRHGGRDNKEDRGSQGERRRAGKSCPPRSAEKRRDGGGGGADRRGCGEGSEARPIAVPDEEDDELAEVCVCANMSYYCRIVVIVQGDFKAQR